jgi:hypothetical protein
MDLAAGGLTAALIAVMLVLTEVIKYFLARSKNGKTTDHIGDTNRRLDIIVSKLDEVSAALREQTHRLELQNVERAAWREKTDSKREDILQATTTYSAVLQTQDRLVNRVGDLIDEMKAGR